MGRYVRVGISEYLSGNVLLQSTHLLAPPTSTKCIYLYWHLRKKDYSSQYHESKTVMSERRDSKEKGYEQSASTTDENMRPKEAILTNNEAQHAAIIIDQSSDFFSAVSRSYEDHESIPKGETRNAMEDDHRDDGEKGVDITSVRTQDVTDNDTKQHSVSTALEVVTSDTEDDENINLETSAAVAKLKSAAMKKKKGKKTTTAAEVAKKEMQWDAPAVKKKKNRNKTR